MYRHLLVPIDEHGSVHRSGGQCGRTGARRRGAHHLLSCDRRRYRSLERRCRGLALHATERPRLHRPRGRTARQGRSRGARVRRALRLEACAVNDQPAAAIVEAARSIGCDLVFMAAHEPHQRETGAASPSTTLGVVLNSGLPVLVSGAGDPGASGARHRHHPRRAPIAGGGAACLDAGAGDSPQCRRSGRPEVDAGHRALHRSLFGGAAPPEGRRAPVQAPARTHQHGQRRTGRAAAPARARPPACGRSCSCRSTRWPPPTARPRSAPPAHSMTQCAAMPRSCGSTWAARRASSCRPRSATSPRPTGWRSMRRS